MNRKTLSQVESHTVKAKLSLVLLLLIALALSACDSIFEVQGGVYEWRNAPPTATTQIIINDFDLFTRYWMDGLDVVPLTNAYVAFFIAVDTNKPPTENDRAWDDTLTDERGRFYVGGTGPPPGTGAIRVKKDGYVPAVKVFTSTSMRNTAVILMVRQK